MARWGAMTLACQECDRGVAYHEVDSQTVFVDGEFRTVHRCPYCEAELEF